MRALSLSTWSRAEHWLLIGGGVSALALLPLLILGLIDGRTFNGIDIWIKPAKFFASLSVHLITLAVLLRLLEDRLRGARPKLWLAIATTAIAWAESLYIALQAGRGRASHWNQETAWEAAAYGLMGLGAVFLVAMAGLLGLLILLRARADVGPGLKWGAGLGLLWGFVTTLVVGAYLGGQSTGHWVGGTPSDAGGLPVVGWSRDGGDLRVAHFFALHMMQVLPVLGWLADRFVRWPRSAVALATTLGVMVVALTFAQAIGGRPFL